MNIKYGIDLKRKAKIDEQATAGSKYSQRQSGRRLAHGLQADDLYIAYACAMVKVAIDKYEANRPLWVDIRCAWDKPGCVSFDNTFFKNDHVISQWFDKRFTGAKEPIPDVFDLMVKANQEWAHPDITRLMSLIDSFIVKAFNGPIKPALQNRWGTVKDRPVPKYKVRVIPEKAWRLRLAVFLLSWTEYKEIDLQDVDRERMGADYDLVTSGEKPSKTYGRKRKPKINEFMHKIRLSYIKESTIYEGAEKWYQARVIRGSIVDATSDYQINNPSTFERLIEDYDHIAEIR